ARDVTVTALVDRRHVVLVEDVVEVELQLDAVLELVAGHQVGDPVAVDVGRRTDGAVAAAGQLAGVAGAAADDQAVAEAVGGPAGEGVARGVGEHRGAVGGDARAFHHLGVHQRVAGRDRPALGNAADRAQLDAAHTLLAGLVVLLVDRILDDLVQPPGLVQGGGEQQAALAQLPLAAEFGGARFLRVEGRVVGVVRAIAQLELAAARRLVGDGVVGVQAAVRGRLVQGADVPAQQGVGEAGIHARHRRAGGQVAAGRRVAAAAGHQVAEIGAVAVHAQAAVELPLLVQVDGV